MQEVVVGEHWVVVLVAALTSVALNGAHQPFAEGVGVASKIEQPFQLGVGEAYLPSEPFVETVVAC